MFVDQACICNIHPIWSTFCWITKAAQHVLICVHSGFAHTAIQKKQQTQRALKPQIDMVGEQDHLVGSSSPLHCCCLAIQHSTF